MHLMHIHIHKINLTLYVSVRSTPPPSKEHVLFNHFFLPNSLSTVLNMQLAYIYRSSPYLMFTGHSPREFTRLRTMGKIQVTVYLRDRSNKYGTIHTCWVQGQLGLQPEFQDGWGYVKKSCLKKEKKKEKGKRNQQCTHAVSVLTSSAQLQTLLHTSYQPGGTEESDFFFSRTILCELKIELIGRLARQVPGFSPQHCQKTETNNPLCRWKMIFVLFFLGQGLPM